MAPNKITSKPTITVSTRSRASTQALHIENIQLNKGIDKLNKMIRGKRKADCSPSKDKVVKRSALGDLTNNAANKINVNAKPKGAKNIKKVTVRSKILPSIKTVQKPRQNENLAPPPAPALNKVVTRAAVKQTTQGSHQTALKSKEFNKENAGVPVNTKKRLSNEFEKSEESLYSSALEDVARRSTTRSSKASTSCSPVREEDAKSSSSLSFVAHQLEIKLNFGNHTVPEGVQDYDKDNWDDVYQVSHYAMDIFNYYKDKETQFPIGNYMERQVCLTKWMRSLLVDWMVEIQESFELNHETLYLGVKLVDMYLDRVTVSKEMLQLVGAAAMFIASKFDERIPPMLDDFLYICDGAYTRREMIKMEVNLLKIVGFNLGIPISYRFLRRYARCGRVTMPVLTLARYILEFSLMEYETISIRDSLLASAALYLALRMKHISGWTRALEFYSGYSLQDIKNTVLLLNRIISKPQKAQIMTVRNKYSHKIFFEVAKTPLISEELLF